MPQDAFILQSPAGPAAQLILLFHRVGSNARSMAPLGHQLAERFPQAMVVSVNSPTPSHAPGGFEWFSVAGITEENRLDRITQAMPAFIDCIQHWQTQANLGPEATALVGFSQGAIMALESTQITPAVASRVVAISGRFAQLPAHSTYPGTIHFLHGKQDAVIPYSHTVLAAHHLRALDTDITAEVLPFIGHEVHPEFVPLILDKLATHISHRIWTDALQPASPPKS